MGKEGVERTVVEVQEGVEGAVVEGQEGLEGAIIEGTIRHCYPEVDQSPSNDTRKSTNQIKYLINVQVTIPRNC